MSRLPALGAALSLLYLTACADRHDLPIPPNAVVIDEAALDGLSGLIHSLDHGSVLWAVNDNDILPRLFRVGTDGLAQGRVRVRGALVFNAEALTMWDHDGEHHDWILIGDIGDNRAMRRRVHVYAAAEPDTGEASVEVAWRLSFRYPDGARDAEAMTVDHQADELLIITKRDSPARLYRIPLAARGQDGTVDARFETTLPDTVTGRVTDMALSRDGRLLAVLTYDAIYLWQRMDGADWAAVLAVAPRRIAVTGLAKAESIALEPAADGSIFVASEKLPAVLSTFEREFQEATPP